MTWRVYADVYDTGELTGEAKSQALKATKNILVKAIRTVVVLVGNPTFTNLKMEVYDNNILANLPSTLKAESMNSFNLGDILTTHPNGVAEIYFEFIPFGIRKTDTYHIVLKADTYVPTANSFLAWRNAWPDPVYKTNYTPTGLNFLQSPYLITAVIGSES
jgi:hypothetical protein